MKKNLFAIPACILFFLAIGSWTAVQAQESQDEKSQATVPWDEFKKLLHLDENEIILPMETFQKILLQTGVTTLPPHTMNEGNVVLTLTEFKKLIEQMKPPAGADITPLPFKYLITKAVYRGKMADSSTGFKVTFQVHALEKNAYLKIPILPQSVALEDVRVDGQQALLLSENGFHHVVLSRPGTYLIEASFSLESSLEKGPHRVDLSIQETPITLFELEVPLRDIDVEIPESRHIRSTVKGNSTVINAIIAPTRTISCRWRKKVPVAEKVAPKVYSEIYHLISIEDDALKINSDILYNILHSEVDGVRITLPEEMNVLTVQGEGVGEWQEMTQNNQRLIHIPFTYGKKGTFTVNVTSEKTISEASKVTTFSGIKTLESVRETGYIGIELNTSAEVKVTESEGLEVVAVQKLPPLLYNKSVKPMIYGFKYLKHPYHLILDIEKHEKLAVPVATINLANMVTLYTVDGKVVHRLIYQIRNSSKQFLKISLPQNADVWSVFVGNEPVESSINAGGELLIPLIRSRSVDNRLDTFPVEVIYCLAENRFSVIHSLKSSLPAVDLLTSQILWSVYLPSDYIYLYFRSTLEKEEMIRGLNVFSGSQRRYNEDAMKSLSAPAGEEQSIMDRDELKKAYEGKDYKSKFRNLPLKEDQLSSQIHAELEFGGRLEDLAQQELPQSMVSGLKTGVLPIQIEIPIGGQVYRFAKTIVKSDDPLTMSVFYVENWVITGIRWFILILFIWILYLKRKTLKRIFDWFTKNVNRSHPRAEKVKEQITKMSRSFMTLIVLSGLVIVFYFISKYLTLLFLFLLWLCAVYQIILHYRKREEKKPRSSKKNESGAKKEVK